MSLPLSTSYAGTTLLVLAAVGTLILACQLGIMAWVLWRTRRAAPALAPVGEAALGFSILKPLCGVDDDLEANLARFAELDYPRGRWEVLLGVKDARDPAYAVAQAAVARWPDRFRLLLQQGEPGLNPKVNQLITLTRHAHHEVLVVSDSNVRVRTDYLVHLAHAFADPRVATATHPVAGCGETTLGSLLDNLHLASSAGAGQLAAKYATDKDLVVGKSMALRRRDLEALGGWAAVKDVLAEDYVLGQWTTKRLGKRVAVVPHPVFNVSLKKGVGDFYRRYLRWSVIQRTSITLPTYLGQALLNPIPLALLGLLLAPSRWGGLAVLGVAGAKMAVDVTAFRLLRQGPVPAAALPAVLLKDALLFVTWCYALFSRTVVWRGNRLRVHAGSRLVPLAPAPVTSLPTAAPAVAAPEAEDTTGSQVLAS